MDSTTLLDRALFQLTPTRTRFELVLFSKGKNEKLASGLFEPFISHLKFARDEISKGGYSISLLPPAHGAPWFTKATFERFVCFVSTPAVLERFVIIEREILQIDSQANEISNTNEAGRPEGGTLATNGHMRKSSDSSQLKGELERKDETTPEENSKIQLQRLLETRKALLRKEQAMAYARGLVAGFTMEYMDDLISFADTFGAARLREACTNFKELCNKKHADHLWMEELAAVEACSPSELSLLGASGIVLTNGISTPNQMTLSFAPMGNPVTNEFSEASKSHPTTQAASLDGNKGDNSPESEQTPSTASKCQVPMQWANQMPQSMYNFQGLVPQLPSYQGYPFPPMQPLPVHYPRNMQWPPNRNKKSYSGRKEKLLGEERQTDSSSSDSESDSDSQTNDQDRYHSSPEDRYRTKQKKKSSRKIVIRNINYITPKRREGDGQVSNGSSSDGNNFIDEDSLKQKIEDAVGSLEGYNKLDSSNHKKKGDKSNGSAQQNVSNDLNVNASEGGKRNDNWEALQNLLMRDEDESMNGPSRLEAMDVQEQFVVRSFEGEISATTHGVDLSSEKVLLQRNNLRDSFAVTERTERSESRMRLDDLMNGENCHPVMKRSNFTDEDLLYPKRLEETGNKLVDQIAASANKSSIMKPGKEEGWFISNHSGKPECPISEQTINNGEHIFSSEVDPSRLQKSRKEVLVDDSFMVQDRMTIDEQYVSQWKTDISMVADLTLASNPENGTLDASHSEGKLADASEPDDLFIVLERNSMLESARDSWTMDYELNISFTEANRSSPDVEAGKNVDEKLPSHSENGITKKNDTTGIKKPGKEARSKVLHGSLGKSRAETMSKGKKPSIVNRPINQKSKLEKEEELRNKMEELLIQRQKRIAERTAASGHAPAVTKKSPLGSKTAKNSIGCDKNKNLSTAGAASRASSVKLRAT